MLVKEIVSSILDLCKISSDDSFISEELILFLCKKYRAFLLRKELEKKNASDLISEFEYQEICLDLERTAVNPCLGYYLTSTVEVPKIFEGTIPKLYPKDFYSGINICFVPKDKMRYVGTNKYLQNIIYASIGPDFHIYLSSSNPQFSYLKQIRVSAVFEDPEEAAKLSCNGTNDAGTCDIMEAEFPMREYLVPMLIELVVKEITGAEYKPEDTTNNSSDDLSKVNVKS